MVSILYKIKYNVPYNTLILDCITFFTYGRFLTKHYYMTQEKVEKIYCMTQKQFSTI